jgi:pantothenate kinase
VRDAAPPAVAELLSAESVGAATPNQADEAVQADPVSQVMRALRCPPDGAKRLAMFRRAVRLCPRSRVRAAGYTVEARITALELWRFYLPLCRLALQPPPEPHRRSLFGVTGPGASGKTVLCYLLGRILRLTRDLRGRTAGLCSLDGFHYPNAVLADRHTTGATGRPVPLISVKGAPPTFDAPAFVACLQALRAGGTVRLPRYDRRTHDPVPDAVRIGPRRHIVLVEGNYLLLVEGAWADVRPLLNLCLFIDQPQVALKQAMVARHVRGGRAERDALHHYETVDRPNADLISATQHRADLVLERDQDGRIVDLRLPDRP